MKPYRQVAPGIWLGFAWCPADDPVPVRQRLWARDREAADRAVAVVLDASGYRQGGCALSRSHTRGVGAAMAAPGGFRVGLDLVEVDRVRRRHAEAILSGEEWEMLAPFAAARPALAWALKEAAAKAAGDPLRCFPDGIRIAAGGRGFLLSVVGSGRLEFTWGWGLTRQFLYAWLYAEVHRVAAAHQPESGTVKHCLPEPPSPVDFLGGARRVRGRTQHCEQTSS